MHGDCYPADKYAGGAHTHDIPGGYFIHRPAQEKITKAVTYKLSMSAFRRLLGITEGGPMEITVTEGFVEVSVKR
jgi:hypothetical protein